MSRTDRSRPLRWALASLVLSLLAVPVLATTGVAGADSASAIVAHYNRSGAFQPSHVHPDDRLLMAYGLLTAAASAEPPAPSPATAESFVEAMQNRQKRQEELRELRRAHGLRDLPVAREGEPSEEFDRLQARMQEDPLAVPEHIFEGVDLLAWSEAVQAWVGSVVGDPGPLDAGAQLGTPSVSGATATAANGRGQTARFVRVDGRWFVRLRN